MFPKIYVFITKAGRFRASVKLCRDRHKQEMTVGGDRWSTKEFSGDVKDRIKSKCSGMLSSLVKNYMEVFGIKGCCEISNSKGSFRIYTGE